MASSLQLGVRMVLKRASSSKRWGQWQRQQMPSASNITTALSGRFFISRGKNSCMYRSRPKPGPMIQLCIAFSHPFSFVAHSSVINSTSRAGNLAYSYETNTGCTIISGEQDLMAGELNLEQKMWERSPPTRSAEMAEQKGAPVNSKDPPTTAILPFSPFLVRLLRSGKAPLSRFKSCMVVLDADIDYLNYYQSILATLLATAMDEAFDHRARCLQLEAENEFLRSELQEFQFREKNLRKELEIMTQVTQERPQQKRPQREESLQQEVEQLKSQMLALYAEKQQLEASNRNYQEKVNDLKYNNAELKNLNDRTTQLHLKEIQMMKKEAAQNDSNSQTQEREKRHIKQKESLEKKLQSCAEIAKEMENYYVGEIKKLKQTIRIKDEDIRSLTRQLQGTRTQRMSQGESVKQCNQKWEKACGEMREEYELQIKELRNKVKFLINKLESMQQSTNEKQSLGGQLIQSKMVQSNASIDSFRFTPNSSVSSSKEPAQSTRRNTSGIKASQVLTQKMGKSYGPLAQRNNF